MRVHLFGGLSLIWHDEPLPVIPSRTARSLCAYLITYHDRPHTRDLLAGTFWPDLPDAVARRRLSQALWRIRSTLEPCPLLLAEGDTIQLNPDLPLWTDVEEFGLRARSGGQRERLAHDEQLVDLYRGDFLAGIYDDWLLPERERLRDLPRCPGPTGGGPQGPRRVRTRPDLRPAAGGRGPLARGGAP